VLKRRSKLYMLKTYDNLLESVVLITYDDNLKDQAYLSQYIY